jgi:hypothetical protein
LIIGILVFSGFGTSAYTNDKELNNLQIKRDFQNNRIINGDELDQYQMEMEEGYAMFIGEDPDIPYLYYIAAQEFIPTKRILTRVELLVCKDTYTTYDLTVAIRDVPEGSDLTSISKNSESIPTGDFTWIEFDFDDIEVIPGYEYYIVCSTVDAPNNRYYWGITMYDSYPNGSLYWYQEGDWYFDTGIDTTFKTYGFNNLPPNTPTVDGPNTGKPNTEYDFTFNSFDPDGDDVRFNINWGDGNIETTPFTTSGNDLTVSHSWNETGTYILRVYAEDEHGAMSDEITGQMIIKKSKSIQNTMFQWFLEQFLLLSWLFQRLRLI